MIRWVALLTLVFAGWKLGPVYTRAVRFHFAVQEVCKTGATGRLPAATIHDDILLKARQLRLPVQPEDVEVKIEGKLVKARVGYEVPVDLLVHRMTLRFQPVAEEYPFLTAVDGSEGAPKTSH